ncbi:mannose-6-phosphate isomerase, class I [Actinomadura parmotrematis]|uniref:mannose-6-phosphate isomerase n=1 Tax=Actinomadura parmotrematis TaxID=2864039 RepID=A0ABS7G3A9_9ACTN|nr:mannose-6-phosphate isomerase, class I [Actinomadura parmotrematis]MBW8487203.1 mannose-6-phosphate isomerase, class I [Actinomadura parmotrematis]
MNSSAPGDAGLLRLANPVRTYAWGSRTTLAALRRRTCPSPEPEAELWIGAHPAAPSRIAAGPDLPAAIAADPRGLLGPGRDRLPFLLKILAVAAPLSIQVHPDAARAAAGFAREEARGLARDDPARNYRDDWPKPELVCALSRFEALCGFREPGEAAYLLREPRGPRLDRVADALAQGGPAAAFALLDAWPAEDRPALVAEVRGGSAGAHGVAARIARDRPDDPGCVAALLLNLVVLRPGQGLYVRPRTVHAYLHGTAVEIMASSDNVLRGGLTAKHVDRAEFAAVADFAPAAPEVVEPERTRAGEELYPAPVRQFRLTRLCPLPSVAITDPGPSAIVCVEGSVEVLRDGHAERLNSGEAVFVPYGGGRELVVEGDGLAFRASAPPPA